MSLHSSLLPASEQTCVVASSSSDQYTDIVVNSNEGALLGRIFLPRDEIDPEALKQVQSMCVHPACRNCRSMPDTCKGNGCSVGFTSQLTSCISPQLIGGDIACGISAIPIPKKVVERRNGLERILNIIHAQVPMGSGSDGVHHSAVIRLEQYVPFLEQATIHWRQFSEAYMEKFGVNLDQHVTQKYGALIPPPHEAENVNAYGNALSSSSSGSYSSASSGSSSSSSSNPNSQQSSFSPSTQSPTNVPASTSLAAGQTSSSGLFTAAATNSKSVAKFQYTIAWLQKRVQEWGISIDQLKCGASSLGSGNHFIEIGQKTFVLDDHTTKPTIPKKGLTSRLTNNNTPNKQKKSSMNGGGDGDESIHQFQQQKGVEVDDDLDANILKSFGARATNRNKNTGNNNNDSDDHHTENNNNNNNNNGKTKKRGNDNSDEDGDDKDGGDENENGDNLPEYLLSCHTGSRICGQSVYRFWTKKCAKYQQARIQLQQLQMLQQQLANTGGKMTQEQEKDLLAAAAIVNVSLGRKPNAPPPLPTSSSHQNNNINKNNNNNAITVDGTGSTTTTPEKQRLQQQQPNTSIASSSVPQNLTNNNNNNNDEIHDENINDSNNTLLMMTGCDFPLPKNDDDENIPFNTSFLLTAPEDVACYYMDVIFAQAFASMNRRAILSTIFYALGDKAGKFKEENMIETVHNYIDFKDFVIRKGAIRAHDGEKVLIGLNMKEGLWLAQGKGNAEWNNSCAHGCGRIMSRKAAGGNLAAASSGGGGGSSSSSSKNSNKKGSNKQLQADGSNGNDGAIESKAKKSKAQQQSQDPRLKQFRAEMGDVVSQSVNADTFDERPSVYRNSSLVRTLIEPSVEVICRYKTILNAKGGSGTTM